MFRGYFLDHIKVLNQRDTWISVDVDVAKLFRKFAPLQTSPYSLARDGIADITSGGEFVATLNGAVFEDVIDNCPCLESDHKVTKVLNKLFPSPETTFQWAETKANTLDKDDKTVKYITSTLDS